MAGPVPRSHILGILLVFGGLFSYYFTYYAYMRVSGNEQPFAAFLASILSIINPPDAPAELAFTAPNFYINDVRAALFWLSMSCLVCLGGAVLAILHRMRFGPSRLFMPLCFSSIVVACGLAKVTFDLGLINAT